MWLSYIPGTPDDFTQRHPRNIRHYTSPDLERWTYDAELWRHLGLDSRATPVPDPADSVP